VNGVEVANTDGAFSMEVALGSGANKIEVKSMDDAGNKTYKTITVNKEDVAPAGITLSGSQVSTGIKLTWTVSNVDTSKGFKIIKSSSDSSPTYPENSAIYVSNGATRTYTVALTDGQAYYLRICSYNGSGCATYSNVVKVTAPTVSATVSSISLSNAGSGIVNWSVSGYSQYGFKLVWSKNSGPTYPLRAGDQYQYWDNPSTTTNSGTPLTPFSGSGTYYVRVCEYLGGSCGKYSNQITITL
jgi:hypothetical protein